VTSTAGLSAGDKVWLKDSVLTYGEEDTIVSINSSTTLTLAYVYNAYHVANGATLTGAVFDCMEYNEPTYREYYGDYITSVSASSQSAYTVFYGWKGTGGVSLVDEFANPAVLQIRGDGTLKAYFLSQIYAITYGDFHGNWAGWSEVNPSLLSQYNDPSYGWLNTVIMAGHATLFAEIDSQTYSIPVQLN